MKTYCLQWINKNNDSNNEESNDEESFDICMLSYEEIKKSMYIYERKKNIELIKKYYDIGFFDIWIFSNNKIKVAINITKSLLIDIH